MRGWGARGGAVLALAAVAALGACSASPMPAPTPEYTSTYITPPPTALAPLTGATVAAGSLSNPSLAAKIDNHPAARPQVGLERTDLVFEELVEGGLTRYVAVWQSDVPAEIGPIRSIRPMDPDIVSPLGGIIAYSGGQQRFVDLMRQTNVLNAIHGQSDTEDLMYRTNAKAAPHNVIVRAEELVGRHPELAAPAQQFAFALDAAASTAARDGGATTGIALRFGSASAPSWSFDAGSGRWLRFQDGGAPDTDSNGAQLSAANVVVLRVPVSNGLGLPKTELIGSGEAWIATAGSTVHATWSKASTTDPIRLVDDTGTVIRLAPGNSWIELVPVTGSVDFAAATS